MCGGDTGLECPSTTTPTTAPGLPLTFHELDTRASNIDKRVVCSTIAGVDCSDLPSPSTVPSFPTSVRILRERDIRDGDVVSRDRIPLPSGLPHTIPTTGLPDGGEGPGAVIGGKKPDNE